MGLKKVIFERLKVLNSYKVEYGLYILNFFSIFNKNKVKNIRICVVFLLIIKKN